MSNGGLLSQLGLASNYQATPYQVNQAALNSAYNPTQAINQANAAQTQGGPVTSQNAFGGQYLSGFGQLASDNSSQAQQAGVLGSDVSTGYGGAGTGIAQAQNAALAMGNSGNQLQSGANAYNAAQEAAAIGGQGAQAAQIQRGQQGQQAQTMQVAQYGQGLQTAQQASGLAGQMGQQQAALTSGQDAQNDSMTQGYLSNGLAAGVQQQQGGMFGQGLQSGNTNAANAINSGTATGNAALATNMFAGGVGAASGALSAASMGSGADSGAASGTAASVPIGPTGSTVEGESSMSDARAKTEIRHAGLAGAETEADAFLDTLKPFSYEYKNPADSHDGAGGRYLGIMAQNVERAPTGETLVKNTPGGKMIQITPMVSGLAAAVGRLHERTRALEGGR